MSDQINSEHGKALSRLGASKGGEMRAAKLTSEERQAIARQAAESRWSIILPRAPYDGQLKIADRVIHCAVLENGKRLITQGSFMTAIGRSERAKAGTGSERLVSAAGITEGLPP